MYSIFDHSLAYFLLSKQLVVFPLALARAYSLSTGFLVVLIGFYILYNVKIGSFKKNEYLLAWL